MKNKLQLSSTKTLHLLASFIILTTLIFSAFPVWATPVPLRSVGELSLDEVTSAYKVNTAKVIIADYELLQRDFPTVLGNLNHDQIDQWLLQNAALMARTQCEKGRLAGLNETIQADTSHPIQVYRPIDYGRGLVFKVGNDGKDDLLIDAKGVGAKKPKIGNTPFQRGHSDGLGTVDEMIHEYAFEKLVHKIFIHSKTGFDTVESYAVIDLGFRAYRFGTWPRAGMVLRQAHKRYIPQVPFGTQYQLRDQIALKVETVLRQYGLSSAFMGYPRNKGLDERYQNVQGTVEENAVVDFGPYAAVEWFDSSLLGMDDLDSMSHNVLMDRYSLNFIQPDPELRVDLRNWGVTQEYKWIQLWINWLQSGERTKEDFIEYLNGLYEIELDRWQKYDSKKKTIQPKPSPSPSPSPSPFVSSDLQASDALKVQPAPRASPVPTHQHIPNQNIPPQGILDLLRSWF